MGVTYKAVELHESGMLRVAELSTSEPGTGQIKSPISHAIKQHPQGFLGSGANDAGAAIIPLVTRNTIANDALNAAPVIGRVSGDQSAVLPPGQVYRDGVPVTGPAGVSTKAPSQPAGSQADEKPADPLRIRLQRPPHRLASDASGNLVKSDADRAP